MIACTASSDTRMPPSASARFTVGTDRPAAIVHRNALAATDFFPIPPNRVTELGRHRAAGLFQRSASIRACEPILRFEIGLSYGGARRRLRHFLR
jgi:hypothetical protein